VIRHVLDTDNFSLFLAGHPEVVSRVLSLPAAEMAISVITVSELVQGWQAQIN
jgi:predicted nucleic acid-binding protein